MKRSELEMTRFDLCFCALPIAAIEAAQWRPGPSKFFLLFFF